ncbi:MAG TPA: transporter substrate-binding domain-containing protein [Alphaproteobacteria bacterium]|nr:transporter substrate-binding domain-containing protein [Alphaproteobacteria bacterium]
MVRSWPLGALFAAALLAAPPGLAEDKIVRLTSLEWPPYASAKMPEGGASVAVARAAFAAVGYSLEVQFLPWNRAVETAQTESGVAGYFPEYTSPEVAAAWSLSAPLGTSPLGFAEATERPASWATLDDIAKLKVGVVKGYVNTAEIDARIAAGTLPVDGAPDDLTNLRKLAAGRLDLAVIDANVMRHLLRNEAALGEARDKLRMNAKPLEDKTLHICFRKDAEGERLRALFDEGLAKIDAAAIRAKFTAG